MKKRRQQRNSKVTDGDIETFRAFLGPLAADYSQAELRVLQRDMQAMADILLEFYSLKQKNGGDLPTVQY